MVKTLTAKRDTWLLRIITQSSKLPEDQKFKLHEGDVLELNWAEAQQDDAGTPIDEGNYAQVSLKRKKQKFHNWFCFLKHVVIGGTDAQKKQKAVGNTITTLNGGIESQPKPIVNAYDFKFSLPGSSGTFNMSAPIRYGKGKNKWYEALHFDPKTKSWRKPADAGVVSRIVAHDTTIEKFRDVIAEAYQTTPEKVSISFNSWYRDPETNRRVGGASRSRHCYGDGTDFLVFINKKQIPCHKINAILRPWCIRNGVALASASVFTHGDSRGYFAEWNYGF